MVTMVFYKDFINFSYQKILDSYNLSLKINLKSFNYNTKIVQKVLFEWAKKQIKNEGVES
jgi:hypothetical protein